ncbi:hypothetical protein ACOMHN_030678 [Nucella lapillus]
MTTIDNMRWRQDKHDDHRQHEVETNMMTIDNMRQHEVETNIVTIDNMRWRRDKHCDHRQHEVETNMMTIDNMRWRQDKHCDHRQHEVETNMTTIDNMRRQCRRLPVSLLYMRDASNPEYGVNCVQIASKFTADELHIIASVLSKTVDFDASTANNRFMVKAGLDDKLDDKKRLYYGLPDLMTKVAREELAQLKDNIKSCNVIYMPQICYLLAIPKLEGTDPDDYEIPGMQFMEEEEPLVPLAAPYEEEEEPLVPLAAPYEEEEEPLVPLDAPYEEEEEPLVPLAAPYEEEEEPLVPLYAPYEEEEEPLVPLERTADWCVAGEEKYWCRSRLSKTSRYNFIWFVSHPDGAPR